MKDVVQFTMSHVDNYGSLIQTYALQAAIEKLGHRCRAICYGAPKKRGIRSLVFYFRRNHAFADFRKNAIHHTRRYVDFEALKDDPPKADIYVTGSDQMFNPRWTKGDPSYFLSFLPADKRNEYRKIAYSSSFAVKEIPEELREVYTKALSDYDALSLREQSGVELAERLTGKPATLCCDPTILLTREEWAKFAEKAKRKIRKPYILCYNLNYMVDPYPMANEVEQYVQRELGLPIVFLNGSKADLRKPNSKIIKNATPYEFVDLFLNASFIMTSSFHGTAFALQSGKPFLSYYYPNTIKDSRAFDLLTRCDAKKHAFPIGENPKLNAVDYYSQDGTSAVALDGFRRESYKWLQKALSAT